MLYCSFPLAIYFTQGSVKGTTENEMVGWHHWLDGHVWASSGSWWWTGKPVMLQSMGSQRVGHDWATELNWVYTMTSYFTCLSLLTFKRGIVVRIKSATFGQLLRTLSSSTDTPKNIPGMLVIIIISLIINGQWLQVSPHGSINWLLSESPSYNWHCVRSLKHKVNKTWPLPWLTGYISLKGERYVMIYSM